MSASIISFPGGVSGIRKMKITSGSGITTVIPAGSCRGVAYISCAEILAATTPQLTVAIFDGTTRYYLQKSKPMTALSTVVFKEGYPLNPGDSIEVTSDTANAIDVICGVVENAPAQGQT